jgi:hypothetical protein
MPFHSIWRTQLMDELRITLGAQYIPQLASRSPYRNAAASKYREAK